jgi:hypothetical protein
MKSEHFVTTTTVWVDTAKIIETLSGIGLLKVRLNTHGLKSFQYDWVEEIIAHDPRNSFDFGIYSDSFEKSFMLTLLHGSSDNVFYPMFGFDSIGNQQLKLGT